MAKGGYCGVSSVAHKLKKAYCGVGGVAHKIRKGYIGDANGKARLFWAGGKQFQVRWPSSTESGTYRSSDSISNIMGESKSGITLNELYYDEPRERWVGINSARYFCYCAEGSDTWTVTSTRANYSSSDMGTWMNGYHANSSSSSPYRPYISNANDFSYINKNVGSVSAASSQYVSPWIITPDGKIIAIRIDISNTAGQYRYPINVYYADIATSTAFTAKNIGSMISTGIKYLPAIIPTQHFYAGYQEGRIIVSAIQLTTTPSSQYQWVIWAVNLSDMSVSTVYQGTKSTNQKCGLPNCCTGMDDKVFFLSLSANHAWGSVQSAYLTKNGTTPTAMSGFAFDSTDGAMRRWGSSKLCTIIGSDQSASTSTPKPYYYTTNGTSWNKVAGGLTHVNNSNMYAINEGGF